MSVIHTGPAYADTGNAGINRDAGDDSKEAREALVHVGVSCQSSRPLAVAPGRLFYAAFGTFVRIPRAMTATLCEAFRMVLDAGSVDAVLFARRPLLFSDDLIVINSTCFPGESVLPECGDSRIWSTHWVHQSTVLNSGAVAAFMTHGGVTSAAEAFRSRIPVAVLPLFGDQPWHARRMVDMGVGVDIPRTARSSEIAELLLRLIADTPRHKAAMNALVASETVAAGLGPGLTAAHKARKLLEVVAAGGMDNPLQRLVDPAWAVYAVPDASAATTVFTHAGIGAAAFVLLPQILVLVCIGLCALCCRRHAAFYYRRVRPGRVPFCSLSMVHSLYLCSTRMSGAGKAAAFALFALCARTFREAVRKAQ